MTSYRKNKLFRHKAKARKQKVIFSPLVLVAFMFAAILPTQALAEKYTFGDYDVYIDENGSTTGAGVSNSGFQADYGGASTPSNTALSATTYPEGISIAVSGQTASLTTTGVFIAGNTGNGISILPTVPDNSVPNHSSQIVITDSSPENLLAFNLVDFFDHGFNDGTQTPPVPIPNSYLDTWTFTVDGNVLFKFHDYSLGGGVTGQVALLDASDNPVLDSNNQPVTITVGQNTETFIGIYNSTGSISNVTVDTNFQRNVTNEIHAADLFGLDLFYTGMFNVIEAADDATVTLNDYSGGSISSVVINDTLDETANPVIGNASGNVTLKSTGTAQDGTTVLGLNTSPATGSIVMNSNGTITVAAGTTAGTYSFTYEICEVDNSTNCDTASISITLIKTNLLSGTVYEDINADSNMSDQVARNNVNVTLYKDSGNGTPDISDTVVGTTTTDASGNYNFNVTDGDYWVIVDSKTVSPSAGYTGLSAIGDVWAEQTWGAAGSWGGVLCDIDANSSTTAFALSSSGACFGGRNGDTSDNASTLSTSEHVAKATVAGTDVTDVDWGFSFNAVTNTNNDGDDDSANDRTLQGTVRQFIQNANAVSGANDMRFVPAVPLNEITYIDVTTTHQWWRVDVDSGNGFDDITDSYTTVDGTAHSYTDGVTVRDTNEGTTRSVTETTIGVGTQLSFGGVPRPELEIHNITSTVAKGLAIEANNTTIENLAIYGFGQAGTDNTSLNDANIYVGSVSSWLIDGVYVGVNPDIDQNALGVSYSDRPKTTGIYDRGRGHGVLLNGSGSGSINNTNIVDNSLHGIFLNNASNVDIKLVQTSDNGFWSRTSDGMYVKNSSNIDVQQSLFVDNWGAGIDSEMMTNLDMHHNKINSNRNEGGIRIWGHDNDVTQTVIFNNKVMSGITVVKNGDSYNNYFFYNNYDKNFGVPIDLVKDSTDPYKETLVTANDGVRTPNTGNNSLDYPIMEMSVLSNNQVHIKGYVGTPTQKIEEVLNVEIHLVKKADDDQNGEVFLGDGRNERHGEGYSFNNNCTTYATGYFYCIYGSAGYTSNIGNEFAGVTTDSNKNTSEFGVSATLTDEVDYGDAPSDYGTGIALPFHAIDAALTLGATVDAESTFTHNATADGDDSDGSDDEDAFTTLPKLTSVDTSYTLSVPVNNTTGLTANLVGWIDFNGNQSFDSTEAATVEVPNATAGNVTLTWSTLPADMVAGDTYLRLRLTTDKTVATGDATTSIATAGAYDGEIEDYALTISSLAPFFCDASLYQSVASPSANDPSQLYNISVNNATQTISTVGDTSHGISYNAMGYNVLDNLIYAIRRDSPSDTLVAIGNNGVAIALGTLSQTMSGRPGAGDMDDQGNLYVRIGGEENLFKIDVATRVVTEIPSSMSTFSVADFAWNELDGLFYGMSSNTGQLFSLSTSGTVTPIGTPDPSLTIFGAQFFDNLGNLYGIENATGDLYRFDITDGSYTIISTGLSPASGNDGASCRGAPPVPSGTLSGVVYTDADKSDDYDSNTETGIEAVTVSLYFDNGTPGDTSDDTLVGTRTTAADGSYSFNDVNASATVTYRVEVDVLDTDIPVTRVLGTTNPLEGLTVTSGGTTTADFGFDAIYTLSGTVFEDANSDDIFDNGENTFEAVTITLYDWDDANTDGAVMESELSNPQTMPTDVNGGYLFENLATGSYALQSDNTASALGVNVFAGPENPSGAILMDANVVRDFPYEPPFVPSLPVNMCQAQLYGWLDNYSPVPTLGSERAPDYDIETGGFALDSNGLPARPLSDMPDATYLESIGYNIPELDITANEGIGEGAWAITRVEGVPNSTRSISFIGGGAVEHTVWAILDENGNTLVRYPALPTVSIRQTADNPTLSFTFPANGVVYTHVWLADYHSYNDLSYPEGCDYGDAPNSYGTQSTVDGAAHMTDRQVFLGTTLDAETDGQPTTAANGDGADEDSVTAPLPDLATLDTSYSVTVSATNTSANAGRLVAWIDFDGNGRFDSNESAARTIPANTNAGSFALTWSNIPTDIVEGDTYLRLRITTDTITNGDPEGVMFDGEVEDYLITINTTGVTVSGRVYNDKNVSTDSNSGEVGITELPVVLYDTVNNRCVSTRTDGNGDYRFEGVAAGTYQLYEASKESVPTPANCGVSFAKDPSNYRSTTANASATFTVTTSDITDKDFGDVKSPVFEPNNTGQVLPGNVRFYSHKFSTPTKGNVTFSSVSGSNISSGWTSILYHDDNCDGTLNGSDAATPLSSNALLVNAGDDICLINKVYAPANVAANDKYAQTITADFDFNGNALAGSLALKVQDVTTALQVQAPTVQATPAVEPAPAVPAQPEQAATSTVPATETTPEVPSTPYVPATESVPEQVAVAATPVVVELGPSKLELRKTVRNIDQGTAETETANSAKPGDTLEYRIYYSNSGTGPLTDLVINDTVPAFTEMVGSADCGVAVSPMVCTASPLGVNDDLSWSFTGALTGGSGSSVSYRVKVDE